MALVGTLAQSLSQGPSHDETSFGRIYFLVDLCGRLSVRFLVLGWTAASVAHELLAGSLSHLLATWTTS